MFDIKKQNLPKENFGGIIAEQMGLGKKTLSMLIASALTTDEANSFANSFSGNSNQVGAKATFVIVPSVCKLLLFCSSRLFFYVYTEARQ